MKVQLVGPPSPHNTRTQCISRSNRICYDTFGLNYIKCFADTYKNCRTIKPSSSQYRSKQNLVLDDDIRESHCKQSTST